MGKARFGAAAVVTWVALAAWLAPAASADTTCAFSPSSGNLQVDATDTTRVRADEGGHVVVSDYRPVFPGRPPGYGFVPVPCSDAESPGATADPTTTTTDSIDVRARSLAYDPIGPGSTAAGEGSSPEVEVAFNGTTLSIGGSAEADGAVFGVDAEAGGIAANLNAQAEPGGVADADVIAPNLVALFYNGGAGDDTIDARGAAPVEGALPATVAASLDGGNGTDVLDAGLGPTRLTAGHDFSDDQLHGGSGDDVLVPSGGDGDLIGGAGTDEVEFLGLPGVTVDLRVTEPQVTGRGTKLIREIENVTGSLERDTLIGDDGPNALDGFKERGVIDGGAGDDRLQGEGRLVGGEGDDEVLGSFEDDRLFGGSGNDTLFGSGGVDVLLGEAGADFLRARDRKPIFGGKLKGDRRIDCGPGRGAHERARVDEADPEPRSC
ncbi:MAG TPA: calcium-binding protein [Solirubrobacterales bacterium]